MEITCELVEKNTPNDVYTLIEEHFKDQLDSWTPTKYEHSYDDVKKVFRFDMNAEGKRSSTE